MGTDSETMSRQQSGRVHRSHSTTFSSTAGVDFIRNKISRPKGVGPTSSESPLVGTSDFFSFF